MKDDKLFRAMGDIDEGYLDEAYTYGKNVRKFRKTHLTRWLTAAAVLTVVFSATAAAENLGWGAQIRSWLGIGENQQVEGFTPAGRRTAHQRTLPWCSRRMGG